MTMNYATLTGPITLPGSDIGVRARIIATPLTTDQLLTYTGDDRFTTGPVVGETNGVGALNGMKVPTNSDLPGLLWQITAERLDKGPGPAKWTIKNAVAITGTGTIKLRDLVEVDVLTVDSTLVTSVSDLAAAAGASKTAAAGSATTAAGWADAAASSAADADTSADIADAAATIATNNANGFSAGTVTSLAPGASPTVSITGTAPNRQLNLGIPAGTADDASMTAVATNPTSSFANALTASFVGRGAVVGVGSVAEDALLYADAGNTGLGYYVFKNGTGTTIASTAFGHAAAASLDGGNNNTHVGYAAGFSVTTANETTFVGSYAGQYASGAGNTGIGSRAMCGPNNNVPAMTGFHNTGVGVEALSTISTGSNNTAVGWEAAGGAGNYVPITNITVSGTTVTVTCADTGTLAVGMPLLIENVVGFSANSPNGYGRIVTAILSPTQFTYTQSPAPTGTYTSGGTWLGGSVTGSGNSAFGAEALFVNQRGSSNVALGAYSLRNLENASNNVAAGYAAMNLATTATGCVAVGHQAAFGLTTGQENVFVGKEAGYTATPANKTTTGTGQTHIGYQAGQGSTTQAVQPTTVGYKALTTSHYGTAIGATATAGLYGTALGRAASASGQGSVAIGVDGGGTAATATGFNEFVLGTPSHIVKTPGRLETAAPTASAAKFRLTHGVAPTSPIDGDLWTTTSGMYAQINTTTRDVLLAFTATATLDFPSIAAGSAQELTVTVTGAVAGDAVIVGPPSGLEAGLIASARVSSANTVTVRLANVTSGAIDPASASWKVRVVK